MTDKKLDDQEEQLVHAFRMLPPDEQDVMVRVAVYMAEHPDEEYTMERIAELQERFKTPLN